MTGAEDRGGRHSSHLPDVRSDEAGLDGLTPLVYAELRRLARGYLAKSRGHRQVTLQTTELVHEAYLRLQRQDYVRWQNRSHVIGIAAQMMRRILVDLARRRHAERRGGWHVHVPLDEAPEAAAMPAATITRLDEVLSELATLDPRQARLAELRIFGGQSIEATAEHLDVSPATVKREWRVIKAWLLRELHRSRAPGTKSEGA